MISQKTEDSPRAQSGPIWSPLSKQLALRDNCENICVFHRPTTDRRVQIGDIHRGTMGPACMFCTIY